MLFRSFIISVIVISSGYLYPNQFPWNKSWAQLTLEKLKDLDMRTEPTLFIMVQKIHIQILSCSHPNQVRDFSFLRSFLWGEAQ